MRYQHKLIDGIVVITINENEFFSMDSNEIVETIKSKIDEGNRAFILDLNKVRYLNSTNINLLIAVLTVVRNNEGELVLASISEKVKNLLIITKLNSIFHVKDSVDESIEFLKEYRKAETNQS